MADGRTRSITTDDLFTINMISEPRYSPDGRSIAYVVTSMDREKDDYRSSIYVASTDGSTSRRLTRADAKDSSPRWSPDGNTWRFSRIALARARSG